MRTGSAHSRRTAAMWIAVSFSLLEAKADQQFSFNYRRELLGSPSSLSLLISALNPASGEVAVNGGDARRPSNPFTFAWGDGQTTTGFFPQQHLYADRSNRIVTVTADYGSGQSDTAQILVRFVSPSINPLAKPDGFEVTLANDSQLPLSRLLYPVPATLAPFTASDFSVVPRATIEYLLSSLV